MAAGPVVCSLLGGLRRKARPEPTVSLQRPAKGLWGRFSGAFGSKYPTLQFFSKDGSWEVVQLKKFTGSMVLVKIRGRIYPVIMDGTKAKTYRYAGVPMAQTFVYSMDDMEPVDPTELDRVAKGLASQKLPSLTPELAMLINAAHNYLESTEKESAVTVSDLVPTIAAKTVVEAKIAELVKTSGVGEITKPVPDLVDFCNKRMLVDPAMVSAMISAFAETERQWTALANPARGPFRHWTLVGLFVGVVATIGIVVGLGVTQGWFDDLGGSATLQDIFNQAAQFSTPEEAAAPPAAPPAEVPLP